jgi:hypothetical protein
MTLTRTPGGGTVLEVEQHLAERFAVLRDGRIGPVFFIEHGLRETET